MDGLLILLGISGMLAGIILLVVRVTTKSGLEYKWSILITAAAFVMFIAGVAINPEFQATFRRSAQVAQAPESNSSPDSSTDSVKVEVETSYRVSPPTWNTQDLNVETNGNAAVAVSLLASGKTGEIVAASPAAVFKAPWKYYGKTLKMTGMVSIAQDYPPGSDVSVNLGGGEVGELVIMADDMTIIDYVHLGSTGDINVGDTVIIYGYCIGHVTGENKLGGTTTQLMLIGNKVQKIE